MSVATPPAPGLRPEPDPGPPPPRLTGPRAAIRERTLRRDRWWLQPLITVSVRAGGVRGLFDVLAAHSRTANYFHAPYISPFYSPCITDSCGKVPGSDGRSRKLGIFGAVVHRHAGSCYILIIPLGLPADLLLLPQGLLPVVLAVPAGLRRRGAARAPTPARPGFPLIWARTSTGTSSTLGLLLQLDPADVGRRSSAFRNGLGTAGATCRPRDPRPDRERRPCSVDVLPLLPLLPAHRRRPAQALLRSTRCGTRFWMVVSAGSTRRHMQLAWMSLIFVAFTDFYVALSWRRGPSPICEVLLRMDRPC